MILYCDRSAISDVVTQTSVSFNNHTEKGFYVRTSGTLHPRYLLIKGEVCFICRASALTHNEVDKELVFVLIKQLIYKLIGPRIRSEINKDSHLIQSASTPRNSRCLKDTSLPALALNVGFRYRLVWDWA